MKTLPLIALIWLVVLPITGVTQICKWVDEHGVTHYAERCPEAVAGTEIEMAAQPSPAEVAAAIRQSEQMLAERQARKALRQQDQAARDEETHARDEVADTNQQRCIEARWSLETLRRQVPVYRDDAGQLHFARSLHDLWYEGERTYLDDDQRPAEIAHYEHVEVQTCSERESDIRERIRAYMKKHDEEICGHLRRTLSGMQQASTGLPSKEMRELEETIETRCD
jgi:hypothetical protein